MGACRLGTLLILLLWTASAAPAEVAASLAPAETDDESQWPYRTATLTVDNRSPRIVRQVRLRWKGGGPTFVHDLALAPDASHKLDVRLCAISPEQTYDVSIAFEGDATPAQHAVPISWPLDRVNTGDFLNPKAYFEADNEGLTWTVSIRRTASAMSAVIAIVITAVMLLKRPAHRTIAAWTLAAVLGVLVWIWADAQKDWSLRYVETYTQSVAPPPAADGVRFMLLRSRRTQRVRLDSPLAAPVYLDRDDLSHDETIVTDRYVEIPTTPDRPRLLYARALRKKES